MAPGSPPAGFPAAGGGSPASDRPRTRRPSSSGRTTASRTRTAPAATRSARQARSLATTCRSATASCGQRCGAYGQDGGYGQDARLRPGHRLRPGQRPSARTPGYGQDSGYGQDWGAADQARRLGSADARPARPARRGIDRGQRDAGYPGPRRRLRPPGSRPPRTTAGAGLRRPGLPGPGLRGQDVPGQQDAARRSPRPTAAGEPDSAARMDPALQDFFAPQAGYAGRSPAAEARLPAAGTARPVARRPGYPDGPSAGPSAAGCGTGAADGAQARTAARRATRGTAGRRSRGRRPTRGVADGRAAPRGDAPRRRGPAPRARAAAPRRSAWWSRSSSSAAPYVAAHGTGPAARRPRRHPDDTPRPPEPTAAAKADGKARQEPRRPAADDGRLHAVHADHGGRLPAGTGPALPRDGHRDGGGRSSRRLSRGGGGTVKGNPVSAAYQLPTSQVITFVGYQGTFTPAKVATILASLGRTRTPTRPGRTAASSAAPTRRPRATAPSGAVCVWATTSTLGVTEFFSSTGPEALTASQTKGAADTRQAPRGRRSQA